MGDYESTREIIGVQGSTLECKGDHRSTRECIRVQGRYHESTMECMGLSTLDRGQGIMGVHNIVLREIMGVQGRASKYKVNRECTRGCPTRRLYVFHHEVIAFPESRWRRSRSICSLF